MLQLEHTPGFCMTNHPPTPSQGPLLHVLTLTPKIKCTLGTTGLGTLSSILSGHPGLGILVLLCCKPVNPILGSYCIFSVWNAKTVINLQLHIQLCWTFILVPLKSGWDINISEAKVSNFLHIRIYNNRMPAFQGITGNVIHSLLSRKSMQPECDIITLLIHSHNCIRMALYFPSVTWPRSTKSSLSSNLPRNKLVIYS